jgi:hypothetical protein
MRFIAVGRRVTRGSRDQGAKSAAKQVIDIFRQMRPLFSYLIESKQLSGFRLFDTSGRDGNRVHFQIGCSGVWGRAFQSSK